MPSVPAALRDPLLERDYVRLCSRPAFFRNRALGPALLGAILLMMYGFRDEAASPDEMGRSIHLVFTWLAACLTSATAAAETAVAIPTERSTGSLPVLLTVPRSPLRLAAGFFLSRVLVALTALLAVLPLEGMALLLGGVDIADVGTALLCILAATLFGAGAGLFAGYDAPDHRLAVGRAGLLSIGLTLLLPLSLAVAGYALHDFETGTGGDPRNPADAEAWLYVSAWVVFLLNPLGALAVHTFEMNRLGMPPIHAMGLTSSGIPVLVTGVAAAGALLAVLLTGRRLTADAERATVAAHRIGPWRRFLSLFGRRAPREAAAVWPEALLWKESRPPRNPWVRWGLHLAVLGYAGFLGWFWFSPEIQREFTGPRHRETALFDVLCSLPLWLWFLGTAASTGTLLAEERERRALDLLRAAPFRPRAFFLARFLGTGWRLLPAALATIPFVLAGTWLGIVHPLGVLAWGIGAALVAPFVALLSFRAGMGAVTVRSAQRRVGAAVGVFIVGWPFLHWFLEEAFRARDHVHQVLVCANPFVSVTGPYLLFMRAAFDDDRDLLRMGTAGSLAALVWALLACWLWRRLPGDLDRALHRAEDA